MKVTDKYIIYTRSDLNPETMDIRLENIVWHNLIGAPDLKGKQEYVLFLDDDQRVRILYKRGSPDFIGKILAWSDFRKMVLKEWL